MFRSKRSSLVRRLWRNHCAVTPASGARGTESGQNAEGLQNALKPAAHFVFKNLKDEQLELLVEAVESRGAWDVGCVSFPKTELRVGEHALPAQVLMCKLYRWPELKHLHELKLLCCCEESWKKDSESALVCCNPFHFSRHTVPETPPPPYSKLCLFDNQRRNYIACLNSGDHGTTDISNTTYRDWHDTTLSRNTTRDGYWCKVAYWEHRTRVGRLYAVHEPSVNIFSDLPHGDGFCLGQLSAENRNETVRRTRSKIGHGILLSRELDGVWAYNRSEHPVFVSSPTLDVLCSRTPLVHKVLPGYSLKLFDYERSMALRCAAKTSELTDGPYDPNSVTISFAKGWGPFYSRQFITSCPCWLEILLNDPR
ncbi:mothers against decapentaplegic homolog 6-like [Latimeria chalumnae]|uniref:mothers against decapentaplegic homolog 6-like n=1 Tax=Latimeria chalumnae TaxID=7897 RepID=UPI0003C16601|nr:PREDICTED: mothers against decapentaplegic homolog 6-like [Latimeria chalumnae]XP_006003379.1 PREDICTED: mothers against decapentaplegic homolog 6-like [Latimeria chalumnae]|eukprot:XP_006003378.1 PREDICTED: mothers against decapentaplegic homolog 6-like [Latimeria chalumnae]